MIAKLSAWWGRLGPAWTQPAHRALTVLLVAQIALAAVLLWPRPAGTAQGTPLFPDVQAADVVALTLADNEGQAVTLERGEGWSVAGTDGYPAKADTVGPFLTKLVGLNTGRLVTRTAASQARLQVGADSFQRKITFRTSGGQEHVVYLGSSPTYGATHFRLEGQDAAYLTDALTAWSVNTTAAGWVDTAYVNLTREQVTAITVNNAQGTFTLRPAGEADWALDDPPDGTVDAALLASLAARAMTVYLTEPLGTTVRPEYGLDAPLATITLDGPAGQITLLVGTQDAATKSYVIKSSASAYFVRASDYALGDLVSKGPADLLAPEPTPTPAVPSTN